MYILVPTLPSPSPSQRFHFDASSAMFQAAAADPTCLSIYPSSYLSIHIYKHIHVYIYIYMYIYIYIYVYIIYIYNVP